MTTEASGADIIFLTALSGVGKTTTGDYLAEYCGVHHLDGDNILNGSTINPEWVEPAGNITNALFGHWMKKQPCPEELWHPYMNILCSQIQEALEDHKRIVVTFVVYRREVRDFLRDKFGSSLRFVMLECETDILVTGALARLKQGLTMAGMSIEDWWQNEDPAMQNCGGQKKYGDFCFESYKQMQLENALNGMVEFGSDEKDGQVVDVSSRDTAAFHRVSTALGLVPTTDDVDIDKLKAIATAKMEKYFGAAKATSEESQA